MAKGMTLAEALGIDRRVVAEALGGLPPNKMHCSNLAADGLHKAIADYRSRQQAATPS
jgi:nitrogen fixation NifU-like protein